MEETCYNRVELVAESRRLIPQLDREQREVFDTIVGRQELMFVYGHGWTCKTFFWKSVITTLRAKGKIVLYGIIWDEAPMSEKKCFEALDRTLKDVIGRPNSVFGGKSIMLGGDFRQTLPIKKGASRDAIIVASIAESRIWHHFRVYSLVENMRLQRPNMTDEEKLECHLFSEWLVNIGDGNVGAEDVEDPENASWIRIPNTHCFPRGDAGVEQLIEFIYDADLLRAPLVTTFQDKAIVCPKNENADIIKKKILQRLSGTSEFYISADDTVPLGNDGGATKLLYPVDYLNSMNFPGFPPHSLEVKIGVPVMLIGNLNLTGGL